MHNAKFFHKLGKFSLFLVLLLFILLASILFDIFHDRSDSSLPTQQEDTVYIDSQTPVQQEIYYRQCLHMITTDLGTNSPWVGKTFAEIQGLGWNSFRAEDGQVVLFQQKDSLCPADAVKRHIGIHQGALAIFAGPTNCQGPLLENLGIDPLALNDDMQRQLAAGGIDFANEEDMLSLLENLDEF